MGVAWGAMQCREGPDRCKDQEPCCAQQAEKKGKGIGEMVQWLRALAAFAEDLDLVSSTHLEAHYHP